LLKKHFHAVKDISLNGMRNAFHEYDRFPKFSTFEAFANNGGIQLPVLLIASVVVGPEVGFLMLATRVMAAPLHLVGHAVSQVYLATAAEQYHNGRLGLHTVDVIGGLCKTGVGPLIFAGITAPHLFPFIFGAEWSKAGIFVAWMTPWFIMQFLVSPVSMTLHVTNQQATALILQIFGLILRMGAVIGSALFLKNHVVETYALSGFLFYFSYLFVVTRIAGIKFSSLCRALPLKILLSWSFLSLIFLKIFPYVSGFFSN